MLSLFISRAPTTPLATFAVQDLERICRLFRRATNLPLSAKVLVRNSSSSTDLVNNFIPLLVSHI